MIDIWDTQLMGRGKEANTTVLSSYTLEKYWGHFKPQQVMDEVLQAEPQVPP